MEPSGIRCGSVGLLDTRFLPAVIGALETGGGGGGSGGSIGGLGGGGGGRSGGRGGGRSGGILTATI